MSVHCNNIIAIKGAQKDVLKFIADGMKVKEVELDCDSFTNLTLRSWLPGEDSYQSNIEDLGVKYDSEFTEWECIKDDENDTVICGHVNTTPGFPDDWYNIVRNNYIDLTFGNYTVDEDLEYEIDMNIDDFDLGHISFRFLDDDEKSELEKITLKQFYKQIVL